MFLCATLSGREKLTESPGPYNSQVCLPGCIQHFCDFVPEVWIGSTGLQETFMLTKYACLPSRQSAHFWKSVHLLEC